MICTRWGENIPTPYKFHPPLALYYYRYDAVDIGVPRNSPTRKTDSSEILSKIDPAYPTENASRTTILRIPFRKRVGGRTEWRDVANLAAPSGARSMII